MRWLFNNTKARKIEQNRAKLQSEWWRERERDSEMKKTELMEVEIVRSANEK